MTETFDFDIEADADGDISQRTWDNDFGDGYAQSGGTGINTKSQSWNATHTGLLEQGEEALEICKFLDRHEGYKTFFWTPPGGVQGRYRVKGYKLKARGNPKLVTISWTFDQRFTPY
ncbi:phage tail protein [Pseudomonas palmensis]|jgi:phage-related protein|uniref:phage tail protein n=1 Tax=Pseudomonas palmensis TaxID=2815362 RepID=UPI001AE4F614|nr:phage tail protein [Pseudomonas palmensis]